MRYSFNLPISVQVNWAARTLLRASRALKAATVWRSPGAASRRSAVYSGYLRMTVSTRRITPRRCTTTSPRAPLKTMWGNVRTSAKTSPSFRRRHLQDTQVSGFTMKYFEKLDPSVRCRLPPPFYPRNKSNHTHVHKKKQNTECFCSHFFFFLAVAILRTSNRPLYNLQPTSQPTFSRLSQQRCWNWNYARLRTQPESNYRFIFCGICRSR